MERHDHRTPETPQEAGRSRAGIRLGLSLAALTLVAVGTLIGSHVLSAANPPRIFVSPASQAQLYYAPSPVVVEVRAENLSGPDLTPATGYQYRIQWDATKLQYQGGPFVLPGTPTPVPVLPCIHFVLWPTATLPPDVTPTPTWTHTPTPEEGTPPAPTWTATKVPTPSGAIFHGCATQSQSPPTPLPSGVIGVYKFDPIDQSEPYTATLQLVNVKVSAFLGVEIPSTSSSGTVRFLDCSADVDGNGFVTALDMAAVIGALDSEPGHPNWLESADINNDGFVTATDLALVIESLDFAC